MVDFDAHAYSYVPFHLRDGLWDDIEPIEQYIGGAAPIAPIPYKADYKEVMGYFRAILKKEEISERAFVLTQEVIHHSEGNYNAWFYRRKLIEKLGLSLEDEMTWLQEVGLEKEKNFQIWHHRRCIAEMLGDRMDLDAEMEFMGEIFDSDRKNYHAWSYRIWLIERFQLWESELDFVSQMLNLDKGNNSVWSYRNFILCKAPTGLFKQQKPGTVEFVKSELEYVIGEWLPKDLSNESCWVYLRGLICNTEAEEVASQQKPVKRVCISKVRDVLAPFLTEAENMARQDQHKKGLRFVLPCLIDLNLAAGEESGIQKAREQLAELRDTVDKIRGNYWQWRINKLG